MKAIKDQIIRGNEMIHTTSFRGDCTKLGPRKGIVCKITCDEAPTFAPVYECRLHRVCSPFGVPVDRDLITPCENCSFYSIPRLD